MPLSLECDGADEAVFCENDTNLPRLYGLEASGPFKDGFHDYVIGGDEAAISRAGGSKCAFIRSCHPRCRASVSTMRLRLRPKEIATRAALRRRLRRVLRASHRRDRRVLRAVIQHGQTDAEHVLWCSAVRFAGLLWTKQFYLIDMPKWDGR